MSTGLRIAEGYSRFVDFSFSSQNETNWSPGKSKRFPKTVDQITPIRKVNAFWIIHETLKGGRSFFNLSGVIQLDKLTPITRHGVLVNSLNKTFIE
jgi:hypothetical protein